MKEKMDETQNKYQHPEAILRYGLFNALELRVSLFLKLSRIIQARIILRALPRYTLALKRRSFLKTMGFPQSAHLPKLVFPHLLQAIILLMAFHLNSAHFSTITLPAGSLCNIILAWHE
jgi:hypothetical protein